MIVLEIIAAILIPLSLGAMLNARTHDNLVRVRSTNAKARFEKRVSNRDFFQN
jgi:hypothetical protein